MENSVHFGPLVAGVVRVVEVAGVVDVVEVVRVVEVIFTAVNIKA